MAGGPVYLHTQLECGGIESYRDIEYGGIESDSLSLPLCQMGTRASGFIVPSAEPNGGIYPKPYSPPFRVGRGRTLRPVICTAVLQETFTQRCPAISQEVQRHTPPAMLVPLYLRTRAECFTLGLLISREPDSSMCVT